MPASPPSPHCSSIRRRAGSARPHNPETLRRAAEALAKAGRRDIEINAPGTTSSAVLPALAEAGATQVRAGPRADRDDPAARGGRPAGTPAVAYVTEVSHLHAGARLLLRRRALHRSGVPGLRRQGDRVARADKRRDRTAQRRHPAAGGDRLLRHDRCQRQRCARGRRQRGVRLPPASLRDARLHRRHCRPVGGPAAGGCHP